MLIKQREGSWARLAHCSAPERPGEKRHIPAALQLQHLLVLAVPEP